MTPRQSDLPDRRKIAEGALRDTRNFLENLLKYANVPIITWSKEFQVIGFNQAFERLTGRSAAEVLGKPLDILFPPDRREEAMAHVLSTTTGERWESVEISVLHVDGSVRTVLWNSATLYAANGKTVIATFAQGYDISERKRNEAEKEMLQAQLHQAMKMEAVGRLAGGVAHDFNNLLTVIIGYSELVLQKAGKEFPMSGELEEIRLAGERAALMTQQLLSFSRKQIIDPKVVQLDQLVAEMEKMMSRLISEDITLQISTCQSLGTVRLDPVQFQQILMNLVVNARDAMLGGGRLVIETANVDLDEGYCVLNPYIKPGRFVMLSVSDTGHGMNDEVKAHLFEPFFTTKQPGRGTGLGLATTYGSVKHAGGSIEVYSEVGIGTTMKVYLPCVEGEAVKPAKDDLSQYSLGGTETVLVVEDEVMLRNLCNRTLEHLGYTVIQAPNPAEAITVAKKYSKRIDILLTDVVMPGMNGSEMATQLVLHHPEMKVLFMSGYTEDVITHHGVLAEGVHFIGKPFIPSALARKIREVLDKA
jgi:two-component system cell cycle sensor histidine kinase/response regulator CckA